MKPNSRPGKSREEVLAIVNKHYPDEESRIMLVGLRGYYRDSMGTVGRNDRGIYDDAIFIISPDAFASYNANTDPSIYRKGIATLVPGRYLYHIGLHKGLYKALRQTSEVKVSRDKSITESGFFGINIHKGSYNSTSSLGCQTIYPEQWKAFISTVESEMKRNGANHIPYILIEQQG